MMEKRGTGTFQWNSSGWFGAQVGSTCWMLACGLWFLAEPYLLGGALLLGCFAAANAIGTTMWARRDRLDPYRAIHCLLVVVCVFTAAALVAMDCLGLLGRLDQRLKNPRSLYFILLLFPALMIVFNLKFRPKRSEAETGA